MDCLGQPRWHGEALAAGFYDNGPRSSGRRHESSPGRTVIATPYKSARHGILKEPLMLAYLLPRGLARMRRRLRDQRSGKLVCAHSRFLSSRPFLGFLGLAALGLLLGVSGKPNASFITAPTYPAGSAPISVAVGDFNG